MSTARNKSLANSTSFWSAVFILTLLSVGIITFILLSDDLNPLRGSANNGDRNNTTIIQRPEINITAPEGNNTWTVDSKQTIAWQSTGLTGTITIALINNTCEEESCRATPTRQYIVAEQVSVYDASYDWNIPKNFPPGLYNIDIHSDNRSVFDTADGPVQISIR